MASPIVVRFPHNMGVEEARRRAKEASQRLIAQYSKFLTSHSVVWTGNHAESEIITFGMTFRSTCDIADDHITITVPIPFFLTPWRERIQRFLQSSASELGLPKPK